MAFRTGSDKDTRSGTEGAQTSRQTEPWSVPSTNSTIAQVLPSPDSLPSTKMVEQSLDTCGWDGDRGQVDDTQMTPIIKGHKQQIHTGHLSLFVIVWLNHCKVSLQSIFHLICMHPWRYHIILFCKDYLL